MANSLSNAASHERLVELIGSREASAEQEKLRLLQSLAHRVAALHAAGCGHFAISTDRIAIDDDGSARLLEPAYPVVWDRTAEGSPPEIDFDGQLQLPAELDQAQATLQQAGITCDARRIDIFQLTRLAVRLFSGGSAADYLNSPKAKSRMPVALREIVQRGLGYEKGSRFAEAAALAEALDQVELVSRVEHDGHAELNSQSDSVGHQHQQDTPPRGSAIGLEAETPASGFRPAVRSNSVSEMPRETGLPFEKLGHFEILARLGSGGMGDVYRGYEAALDRPVAVKVLPAELARQADFVNRFRAEATAAAKLIHPNILQIYFIGEEAGHHFFAMQHVHGESLADRLTREKRLDQTETLRIIEQTLAGLAAAHQQDLVHRDIKPGNILLDRETGRALVADFGLVKSVQQSGAMTATGIVMGTADYIAPEQGRGKPVDRRSDLYSLGVLMYQLLSGKLPFAAESAMAMIFQHAYEQPIPLRETVPEIPEPLATIIERLMAKSPDDRYQSAEEVLEDLADFKNGTPLRHGPKIPSDSPGLPTAGAKDTTANTQAARLDDRSLTAAHYAASESVGWRRRVTDNLWDLFRQHAPEIADQMQATQQQVDGAVREYERRREELGGLVAEAQSVVAQLRSQLENCEQAVTRAGQHAENAADDETARKAIAEKLRNENAAKQLQSQLAEQEEQLDTVRLRLAKVSAKLSQLRGQRDALAARLQAAQAQLKAAGGEVQLGGGWRMDRLALATAAAAAVTALVLLAIFSNGSSPPLAASLPAPSQTPSPAVSPEPILARPAQEPAVAPATAPAVLPNEAPFSALAPATDLVCGKLAGKANPEGLVARATAFQAPMGNGRRGGNGFLLESPSDWSKQGTQWEFDFVRSGSAYGMQIVHPWREGQILVSVYPDVKISTSGKWAKFGWRGEQSSNVTLEKPNSVGDLMSLATNGQHAITSELDAEGNYRLLINGGLAATATIVAAQPLDLFVPPDTRPPDTSSWAKNVFTGDGIPRQLQPGEAGLIIGPLDNGSNVLRDLYFGTTPDRSLQPPAAEPQVEIVKATFGTGSAAADVTPKVAVMAQAKTGLLKVSTSGFGLRNPQGHLRDRVTISYLLDGAEKSLVIPSQAEVNLYSLLRGIEVEPIRASGFADLIPSRQLAVPGFLADVSLSHDGSQIAASYRHQDLLLFDTVGQQQRAAYANTPQHLSRFLDDGKTLLVATGGAVELWNSETDKKLPAEFAVSREVSVAQSTAAGLIAFGQYRGEVSLYEMATGKLVRNFRAGGTSDEIWPVEFSSDGKRLVTVQHDARLAIVWDVATVQKVAQLEKPVAASIAILPDGRILATSTSGSLDLFDSESGKHLSSIPGHSDGITGIAASPNGTIVTTSADETARVWDLTAKKSTLIATGDSHLRSPRFYADGTRFALASYDGQVQIWTTPSDEQNNAQVEVIGAIFGSGAAAVDATAGVRYWAERKDGTMWVSTPGLFLQNRRAQFRDKLVIRYKLNEVEQELTLPNDVKVNIWELLRSGAGKTIAPAASPGEAVGQPLTRK